jgi:2-oxo-3-hexenedioate decarboxylase
MDIDGIAEEALAALRGARQIAPFSSRDPAFDLMSAYRVTAAVRRRREAEGERPVGRKIGFTNRTIWAQYGVYAPMWGDIYDSTLAPLDAPFALAGLSEPLIEPEIVFGLSRAPAPDMDEPALLGCVDWVAHGFEIVQSIFPGWRITGADAVAGLGMHGALLIGERDPVRPGGGDWLRTLCGFSIDLKRDGAVVDQGQASNVLGGPLSALRHLIGVLADDAVNPPLRAGEIVTTGTLTRAFPIAPGETWATQLTGVALGPISVTLT